MFARMPNDYDFHPIANIFPMLADDELKALADDIRENGLREAIWLYEGKILDGRNRYTACKIAKIAPITRTFTGTSIEALSWAWSLNRRRRHLNPGQAAIADAERQKLHAVYAAVEQEAKKRKEATQAKPGEQVGKHSALQVPQLIGEPDDRHERETTSLRAKAAGTNRTYIDIADKLVEQRPDLAEQVKQGQKTITQVQRELRQEELKAKTPPAPTGRYRVFYADPPWKYNDALAISKDGVGGSMEVRGESYGPADAHYPQMTISELCDLPIANLAEDNAVLFLWTTSPLLEDSFKVINAWGFKYKASFVWDKVRHNMGHYNSVRHEFLLIATKGSCTPDVAKLFDSVVSEERTDRHSEKPETFRHIIDTLYPSGERIELFARTKRDGWKGWGNEA